MGQKISPTSLRLGITKDWLSKWFGGRKYRHLLKEDMALRSFLDKKLRNMSVDRVEIERSPDAIFVTIYTARPGLIIGRGGTGVDELKDKIKYFIKSVTSVKLDIQE